MNGDLSVPNIVHPLSRDGRPAPSPSGIQEGSEQPSPLDRAIADRFGVPEAEVVVGPGTGVLLRRLLDGLLGDGGEVVLVGDRDGDDPTPDGIARLLAALAPDGLLVVDASRWTGEEPGDRDRSGEHPTARALALRRLDPRVVVVGPLTPRVEFLVGGAGVVARLRAEVPAGRIGPDERDGALAALGNGGEGVSAAVEGNDVVIALGSEQTEDDHGAPRSGAAVLDRPEEALSPAAVAVVARLREALRAQWPETGDPVLDISRYALLTPGKMLRPLLLASAAGAVGGDVERVVPAALAVEYLHVGSLVHDDVIDDDEVRRGQPSVQHRFGVPEAIVVGDALIFKTFSAVAACVELGVTAEAALGAARAIADAGVDVCRGQALEGALAADPTHPLGDYVTVMALKTGALFRGACRAGALLGGGGPEAVEAVTSYAEHLGLAFQVHDDLLPYLSDSAVTGKSELSDLRNLRPTYPVLLAHERGTAGQRARIARVLSGELPAEEAYPALRELLVDTGALAVATEHAEAEVALAKSCLSGLPGNEHTATLAGVADKSVARRR
ncbi:polyprenyl synthetase family protein [Actinosynnema mirum]|uniref:Polyprenyl synthetase n=1 Tax=Actinosynnema mirum (strain ATCC 29888 / DSM 43827 / JCM 3225 / NBRC 14064 / NCIMB 13271 / NRRL B-12336 / IMRU 3971 / 101) TaxID=446462 RepID=C6WK15_ACTMD|nr:polyprenyl synthetase family protein [Actinosynnema mirum]ACU38228.1 Polyprenyl synthetase [Actinosynnema mirum DSM 43827]